MIRLDFRNYEELVEICKRYVDFDYTTFTEHDLTYNPKSETFAFRFKYEAWEKARFKKYLTVFRKYKVPIIQMQFIFNTVKEVGVERDSGNYPAEYILMSLEYRNIEQEICLYPCFGIKKIRLKVAELNGYLEELSSLEKNKTYWTIGKTRFNRLLDRYERLDDPKA